MLRQTPVAPLDPNPRIRFGDNAVVAAVDLDDRKLRRVVAEPILWRVALRG